MVFWTRPLTSHTRTSLPNAIVRLVGTLFLATVSYVEHQRTVHPSLVLNAYLLLSWVFDAANTRTLWLRGGPQIIRILTSASFGVKAVLIVLEALQKRAILLDPFKSYPPEATSGIYSRYSFWWLNPLFRKGYSNVLTVEGLYPLDKHLTTEYLYSTIQPAWTLQPRGKANSLFLLMWSKLKWHILAVFPYRLALVGFTFCQPFLIDTAIHISSAPITADSTNSGYGLIGAYLLVYGGIAVTTGQYTHLTYRAITMARGGLISMLFAKTTSLDIRAVDPGASTTLMSADIERIQTGWQTMHDIWAAPVEIAIAIYLLYRQLGSACGIPIAVAVVSLIASVIITGLVVQRQAMWLEAIEKRIKATTNMLGAMKRVKMCGLADVLERQLQKLRVDELRISKKFRHLLIYNVAFAFVTPVIAPILTFAVFSILALKSDGASTLDTAKAFTALSLFALLADPLTMLIMALSGFAGSVGCFGRIQAFIESKDHIDGRIKPTKSIGDGIKSSQTSSSTLSSSDYPQKLTIKPIKALREDLGSSQNSTSTFSNDNSEKTLQVSMFEKSRLSKDSTRDRTVSIDNGNFGWDAEKEPLLQGINLVAPPGKLTMIVGSVGCGKSTLLKAVLGEVPIISGSVHVPNIDVAYCDQSTFHMNGNIRDSIVAFAIWDEKWYHTVVSACALDEDLRTMPAGDRTMIGSKGIALSGGQSQRVSLARAVYAREDLCILDDVLSGLDTDTESKVFHSLLGQDGLLRRHGTSVILASSSAKRVPFADHIAVLGDKGRITEQGSFHELNARGGYISSLNLRPANWILESNPFKAEDSKSASTASTAATAPTPLISSSETDLNRQAGDASIYLYYVRSVGWPATIFFISAIVVYVFCYSFPTIWLKWWADANARAPNQNLGLYLGVYAGLGVLGLFALTVSCYQLVVTMVPKSGENFHMKLLKTVLGAPMKFFSNVDTGVTLNRFSQDLQLIDMDLPITALNFFVTFVLCVAQVIIIGVSSVYAAASFPFLFLALYFVQRFYLRTSRQLRFLDLEAKSPLYSQFVEMMNGLVTVRAFGWQKALEKKNWRLLDLSQRPYYYLWTVQRWLTLVLDMIVCGVAVLLIVLVVTLRGVIDPGFAGVALANIVLFSQQLRLVLTYWTQMETHIGAIARVKVFTTDTKSEDLPSETGTVPPTWPSRGAIDFQDMSATYDGQHMVLRHVSLSISAGQKVAICGRTGSGKTSLVMAIFRMIESSGRILVDGLDISTIPRQSIRAKIVGLPQDAFLLTGSVRLNADPFGQVTDGAIIEALKDVNLWDSVQAKGGLDADVEEVHLSHGQKQLFSLAQALLRPSPILVLDEATSR